MNILVIGCDQVGASLIRDLERIGHDISLIEKDPEQRGAFYQSAKEVYREINYTGT